MSPTATAAAAAAATGPPPAVYCYSGPGAGIRSVLSTLHSLREALVPAVKVASLDTAELLAGGWQDGCLLLVMPGGADLPYCKHLNGRGNALIRDYVEGGGAYLGLCAGAYYACARVEFEPGSRLEVVGDRELCFFPGKAAGCIYPGFEYESEDGAVAAPLRFRSAVPADAAAAGVAAGSGSNGSSGSSGSGSGSGSSAPMQWEECIDYVNGGPAFLPLDGLPPQLTAAAVAAAVQAVGAPAAGGAPSQLPALQQQLEQADGIEVLATFPQRSHAAAAVRCRVGSRGGRAVLCSSHPELHPSWLSGQRPSSGSGIESSSGSSSEAAQPELVSAGCAAGSPARRRPAAFVDTVHNRAASASSLAVEWSSEEHVQRLQAALTAGRQQRWRFWRSLLAAAGLAPWMLQQ